MSLKSLILLLTNYVYSGDPFGSKNKQVHF